MNGEIIAVGEEVLSGDVINSNAAHISRELSEVGVFCRYHSVVGDIVEDIQSQLVFASERSSIVILCGGLGPTKDDLTKETLAEFLHKQLYIDQDIVENINAWFAGRKMIPTENNYKQALVIEDSDVLINKNGTAPGTYIQQGDVHYFLLPGPPNELIPMLKESVIPMIQRISNDIIVTRTFKLLNIGESHAVTLIDDLLESSNEFILAPYAKLSEVHIKATAIGKEATVVQDKIDLITTEMVKRLGHHIYTMENMDLVDVILKRCIQLNATISTAESCTGGLLSNWIVEKSGASAVFIEGVTTYSNESKEKRLGVSHQLLETFGAVSYEVAEAMVKGLLKVSGTTFGISITGIAGPMGGTDEKPVGLVYIGVGSYEDIQIYEHHFMGNRDRIRQNAAKWALIHLWEKIKE